MRRWLTVIFVVGLLLRVVGINNHPVGFTPDEASFGYDAFSLLQTGKDQWGNSWPLTLKSFGDGKMPLYSYLLIPFVSVFGLSEWVVRLPNALLGLFAIIATYYFVKEWRKNEKEALLAAALLSISPWQIMMSRGAFEANLTTLLMPLGMYLFIKGIRNGKYLLISGLVFGVNMFSYHSARLVAPLLILALIYLYKEKFIVKEKIVNFGIGFGVLLLLAAYSYATGAFARVSSSSIFSLAGNVGSDRYSAVILGMPDLVARIFHNKLTYLIKLFEQNYAGYVSAKFLFVNGPGEYTYGMIPGKGVLYFVEVILLCGFVIGMIREKIKNIGLLLLWVAVGLVPATLSVGPGYAANRAEVVLPAVQIILAIGGVYLYESLGKQYRKIGVLIYSIVLLIEVAFYTEAYLVGQRANGARAMLFGMNQVVSGVNQVEKYYDKVIISKKISEPHIYFAFYNKYNPADYQEITKYWNFEEKGLGWVDQQGEYSLGNKYIFKNIDVQNDLVTNPASLLVVTAGENVENMNIVDTIRYPNGDDAYYLVDAGMKDFALVK